MRPANAVAVALVAAVVGFPAAARAQTDDADALDRRGLDLRRERRDADALETFRRSYTIRPLPRTLAQIALAEQALGRWLSAEADLQRALEANDDWIARHRQVLASGLTDIRAHVATLEVEADGAGANVRVNGGPPHDLPLTAPMHVEAGSVVLEVQAAGYAPARRSISLEPGASARETVHLVPLAPAARSEGQARTPPGVPRPIPKLAMHAVQARRPASWMSGVSYVLLGAGAVGLGAGAAFGIQTLETKGARDHECPAVGCTRTGVALDGEARAEATRSTAWCTFGAVTAVGGASLWWFSRTRLRPDVRTDGMGASVEGSF